MPLPALSSFVYKYYTAYLRIWNSKVQKKGIPDGMPETFWCIIQIGCPTTNHIRMVRTYMDKDIQGTLVYQLIDS